MKGSICDILYTQSLELVAFICLKIQFSVFFASQDVLAKLMSFSQSTSQAVCILSANGSISNVTLQQAAISVGNVTYEVRITVCNLCELSAYMIGRS